MVEGEHRRLYGVGHGVGTGWDTGQRMLQIMGHDGTPKTGWDTRGHGCGMGHNEALGVMGQDELNVRLYMVWCGMGHGMGWDVGGDI